jgi:hypothetical protein
VVDGDAAVGGDAVKEGEAAVEESALAGRASSPARPLAIESPADSGADSATGTAPSRAPILFFVITVTVALAAALRLPATVTVVGLAMFGILHNVLEIRYVFGRFAAVLTGRFLTLLLVLITGIVFCRLLPGALAPWPGRTEILLGYVVLLVASAWGLARRPPLLVAAFAAVVVAAAGSLTFPAYHFVVFAHLHNVVPLFFLWEWARDLPAGAGRARFRAAQVGWVLGIPAVVLAGALDPWIGADRGSAVAAFAGGADRLLAAYVPPAWLGADVAVRFLVVFAFMQTMHYVVWVWFMPRYVPDATRSFERRFDGMPRHWVWTAAGAATALFAVLFATDYVTGKTLYAAVASYHAYVEFPVLLALLLGAGHIKGDRT